MQRKLIQHGTSSLTVSLPHTWVKLNNLKKGGLVDVEVLPEGLLLGTKKNSAKKRIEINISGSGIMLKRMVGACYKTGYDEVLVRYATTKELATLNRLVREHFSGFTILEQKKDSILIKNINQDIFEHFDQAMRRFFHILTIITKEILLAVEKQDKNLLARICIYKDDADDVADYCRRAINKELRVKAGPHYVIIEDLEKVVDTYVFLCALYTSNTTLFKKAPLPLLKNIAHFINTFETAYYDFSLEKMITLGKKKTALDKEIERIKADKALIHISRIVNKVFDLNGALMALYL